MKKSVCFPILFLAVLAVTGCPKSVQEETNIAPHVYEDVAREVIEEVMTAKGYGLYWNATPLDSFTIKGNDASCNVSVVLDATEQYGRIGIEYLSPGDLLKFEEAAAPCVGTIRQSDIPELAAQFEQQASSQAGFPVKCFYDHHYRDAEANVDTARNELRSEITAYIQQCEASNILWK